ncbi:hypothetical protein ACQP2F_32575 [Actinoplanes sp. CA-030573]|uniref:hypothetical protein n=1 Tax=Actinoplanes sp. CA-030573 TaxID=3239898 RepID=UPI003D8D8F38
MVAADDLYFALNDMDAQLANVLLGSDATGSAALYERRRQQVDADVRRLAAANAGDANLTLLLDGLGRYEALAANAMLLHGQHDATQALNTYRAATTLLRSTLLARAQAVVDEQSQKLNTGYRTEMRRVTVARIAVVGVAVLLLILLAELQRFLARRFRRTVNPGVLSASALTVVLAGGALLMLGQHGHDLRRAKQDAFDSIVALSHARAFSYDANADESRYLLDPQRADIYRQAFIDKTQQVLDLPGATLATYDQQLAAAWQAYHANPARAGWGGAMGVEFGNITFAGERPAAELTVERFQQYQAVDRQIRQLADTGRRTAAIVLCTSYAPGGSNYAFERYDTALSDLIAVNSRAFDSAVRTDRRLLVWSRWLPLPLAAAILLLLAAGIRPRLAEYR